MQVPLNGSWVCTDNSRAKCCDAHHTGQKFSLRRKFVELQVPGMLATLSG